jgi:hypothetical protein
MEFTPPAHNAKANRPVVSLPPRLPWFSKQSANWAPV